MHPDSSSLRPHDPATFRSVLAYVPTSVVAVTGARGEERFGMAVGSFTSISLDPPLIGFYPTLTSKSWPLIRATGQFCVNVLGADQQDIVPLLSKSGGDKFAGIQTRPAPTSGAPIIGGSVAWLDCTLEREVTLGDHLLVVGNVHGLQVDRPDDPPLVFHRNGFPALRP